MTRCTKDGGRTEPCRGKIAQRKATDWRFNVRVWKNKINGGGETDERTRRFRSHHYVCAQNSPTDWRLTKMTRWDDIEPKPKRKRKKFGEFGRENENVEKKLKPRPRLPMTSLQLRKRPWLRDRVYLSHSRLKSCCSHLMVSFSVAYSRLHFAPDFGFPGIKSHALRFDEPRCY